jgi:hypothetical protein
LLLVKKDCIALFYFFTLIILSWFDKITV